MSIQPHFEAAYVEPRSRLTTFFRPILAIPHYIVLGLWGFAALFAVVVAWFAIVITGRYPEGLYRFIAGLLRYSTAVHGYVALLTDEYPPFGPDTDDFPVHLKLAGPLPAYSRAKAAFRFLLAIPVLIILYAMQLVWEIGAALSWFAILILGRQPQGLQEMTVLGLSYQQRSSCYLLLLTEDWPPFTDPPGQLTGGDSDGPTPLTSPPPSSPEAPTTLPA